MNKYQTVTVPARAEHNGFHSMQVTLPWVCPECGGPRGEVFKTISWDGSRRLGCDGWHNKCGHLDTYANVRKEYRALREACAELQAVPSYCERKLAYHTCEACGVEFEESVGYFEQDDKANHVIGYSYCADCCHW